MLYLREPRAKTGDRTVVFFQAYSCLHLPSTHPGSLHSLLPSPFNLNVYVCACAVCYVEVRGQPVEWELVLFFYHVDPIGRTQMVRPGSKHLL